MQQSVSGQNAWFPLQSKTTGTDLSTHYNVPPFPATLLRRGGLPRMSTTTGTDLSTHYNVPPFQQPSSAEVGCHGCRNLGPLLRSRSYQSSFFNVWSWSGCIAFPSMLRLLLGILPFKFLASHLVHLHFPHEVARVITINRAFTCLSINSFCPRYFSFFCSLFLDRNYWLVKKKIMFALMDSGQILVNVFRRTAVHVSFLFLSVSGVSKVTVIISICNAPAFHCQSNEQQIPLPLN